MDLWTIQMAKWRIARDLEITFLDTTVKSGDSVFAPSWEIVLGVKSGAITPDEYTVVYTQLMRESYRNNKQRWLEVANTEQVAFACYCPEGHFCHRHILAHMFDRVCQQNGIRFKLRGELSRRQG